MNCFPLIERELRLNLRNGRGGYRLRVWCGAGAMGAAFLVLFVWAAFAPGAPLGRVFLQVLAGAGFLGAVLGGMALTTDALSREKRDGTLDLLFLTDLSIRDVILGKLIANMVVPLYGFLAMVPVLEISVLVGGTTAGECARLYLVWINALFYSMAASLLISSMCREQRTSLFGALSAMLLLAAAIPLAGLGATRSTGNPSWMTVSLLISPSGPWAYVLAGGWFWGALLVNQLLAWTFLALAHRGVLRSRTEAMRLVETNRAERRRDRTAGGRPALLEAEPLQWLMWRRTGTPWLLWTVGAVALGFVAVWDPQRVGGAGTQVVAVLLGIHLVVRLAIATNVTHLFVADRRSGALESLLSTAVDVREMASGILRNFRRRMGGPILVLELATLLGAVRLFHAGLEQGAMILGAAAILLLADSYSLFWVGLFQGMAARSGAVALATAVFEILLLPAAWVAMAMQFFPRSSMVELLVFLAIAVLINHAWFVANAKTNLTRHFRALALKPFGEKNPPIESDWSAINWEEEPSWQP